MRRPWPALVLFLGGALLLVALYLPWQRVSLDLHEFGDIFTPDPFEGWASTVAPAAALAALFLVGLSALALARPGLTTRLPLGRSALAAAYLGVAVAFDPGPALNTEDLRYAYGAYLGLGAAAALLLAVLVLRRTELWKLRSPLHVAAAILALALLLVLLLPWAEFMEFEYRGIGTAPAQVAAVVAICMASAPRGIALLAGLFAAATFSAFATSDLELRYGAWLGIGLAIGFAVLSLSGGIRRLDLQRIPWTRLVLSAAGLLLVTSFFLPWQEYCYAADTFGQAPGPPSSRAVCVSLSAWGSEAASGAALLAIALILGELGRLRRVPSRTESAAGIALFVTTLGFQYGHGGEYDLRYGFWIGVACTAVIVVLAAARVRPPPLDARLAPIVLCLVYLAVVVPMWWGVFEPDAPRLFWLAPFSWLTVAGALLALMLIRLWLERFSDARLLLLIPAVLAALAGLDLARAEAMTWGGGIVLALCGLLALCAFVEQRGGLGELRIPEVLRVDRL